MKGLDTVQNRVAPELAELPDSIRSADADDPLAAFRAAFSLPKGLIYLDGNSLGALPSTTPQRLADVVTEEWGRGLIGSWNSHDWISAPSRVGDKIAQLIGAAPGEVIVADSTSVNLFKLLVAALEFSKGRRDVLTEPGNFPTDLYIAQGVARLLPHHSLKVVPAEEICTQIDEQTAVVMLTHVHYKTASRFDMAAIAAAAHAVGALVLWDLSHSAGAIEVDLNGCDADLAVGCGYKYLNGGPGSPAFLFVAKRLQADLHSPLSGWMGHARRFDFVDAYHPGAGVERFACGTPAILGLAALEQGVDLLLQADMRAITAKSRALSQLLIDQVETRCRGFALSLASPLDAAARGSHVSFRHAHAYEICRALIDRGLVGDFRAPDILRFGLTPLYTSFADIWTAANILADVLATRAWDRAEYRERSQVT